MTRGSSVQELAFKILDLVRAHPDAFVVRLDAASCFETIAPQRALDAAEALGVPEQTLEWLRALYGAHGHLFDGVGRGLAFAPVLASAYLLAVYRMFREHAEHVAWVGDDFLVVAGSQADAETVEACAREKFAELGLALHEGDKHYVGPARGTWTFAGVSFDGLKVRPKAGATDSLIAKVKNKPLERAKEISAGWAGQYLPAFASPEVVDVTRRLIAEFGPDFPKPYDLMLNAAIRVCRRVHMPRRDIENGVRGSRRASSLSPGPSLSSPSHIASPSTGMAASVGTPKGDPSSQGVAAQQLAHLPPGTVPDSFDSVVHPERFAPMPWRTFCTAVLRDSANFVSVTEDVETAVRERHFRGLGYPTVDGFYLDMLGMDPVTARRMLRVGYHAREHFEADPTDPRDAPLGLLKALLRVRSERHWAFVMTTLLLDLVALGHVSSNEAQRATRRALRRAHKEASLTRRTKTKRKAPARWWAGTIGGGRLVVTNSNAATLPTPTR